MKSTIIISIYLFFLSGTAFGQGLENYERQAQLALAQKDTVKAQQAVEHMINKLKPPFSPSQRELILRFAKDVHQPIFNFTLKNREALDFTGHDKLATHYLENGIFKAHIEQMVVGNNPKPDWNRLKKEILKYGFPGEAIYWKSKLTHHLNQKEWAMYALAQEKYTSLTGDLGDVFNLNNYAFEVYQHCDDKEALNAAEKFMEKLILITNDDGNAWYLDTYANLLYKQGKKSEGISAQKRALEIVKKYKLDPKEWEETLQRMESNI